MGRLHHAYLFTGTRGVGKTTIARIFAKSLNCEQGISAEPCGQCDTCLSIENGHYVDLIEIDAASRTKVEDTREILDNVQYAPTRGRTKVYLIDEVHMLSRHSFNALLKTLEEPPEHVKFLLATTDPQKLPITILSRCLQFNLKALMRTEIHEHLSHILTQESIGFEDEAVALLAKAADGSLRDGLSLTDQAIAQAGGELTLTTVEGMLGTIDKQWGVKLLANIVNQDAAQAMDTVEQIAAFMPDYKHLVDQLLSIFHLAAMTQLVPGAAQIDESLHSFITRLAKKLSSEDLQLFYQILLNGKKDIELAPTSRMGFEMLLLRLLAFRPVKVVNRPVSDVVVNQIEVEAELPVPEAPAAPTKPTVVKSQQVAPAQPEKPEPQDSVDVLRAEQLDEQTLNAQQDSILASAEQQGYSPVDSQSAQPQSSQTESAQTESAQFSSSLTQSQENTPKDSQVDDAYSEGQPAYLAMDGAQQQHQQQNLQSDVQNAPVQQQSLQQQTVQEQPASEQPPQPEIQQTPQYEDPVAAILANRNLSLDDMFGGADQANSQNANVEQTPPPQGGEDSVKKPLNEAVTTAPVQNDQQSQPSVFEQSRQQQAPAFEPQPLEQQPFEQAKAQTLFDTPSIEPKSIEPAPLELEIEPAQESQYTQQVPAQPVPSQTALEQRQIEQPQIEQPQIEQPPAFEQQPVEPATEQPQVVQSAEPQLPRWAHEVDEWAALIEKMGLGGLVRLLAVQSVWQKNGKEILLTVQESERHLDSQGLRDQITKGLCIVLNEPIELEFQFTSDFYNTPLNIQRQIDADRLARAKNLIYQDPLILALQQQFDAQVHDESIQAVG